MSSFNTPVTIPQMPDYILRCSLQKNMGPKFAVRWGSTSSPTRQSWEKLKVPLKSSRKQLRSRISTWIPCSEATSSTACSTTYSFCSCDREHVEYTTTPPGFTANSPATSSSVCSKGSIWRSLVLSRWKMLFSSSRRECRSVVHGTSTRTRSKVVPSSSPHFLPSHEVMQTWVSVRRSLGM
ncbi:hypothetical protein FKM82_018910 [Ascaphus truei]